MMLFYNYFIRFNKIYILFIGILSGIAAVALPQEGVVFDGDAIINTNQNQVQITQYSDRAIIDWKNFNIAANEQTTFIQPDSNSIALNRIYSELATELHGQLSSNGKLILINQNGILFGNNAKVDVGGMLATTAKVSDQQALQFGKNQLNIISDTDVDPLLLFNQPGSKNAAIINEGRIIAQEGLIGLVAPNIINKGLIIAKSNKVTLRSGETFALDLYGDNLINIAVSKDLQQQIISNSGTIIAHGNEISLTASAGKYLINTLIEHTGALIARSVIHKKGEIIITAEASNAVINNDIILKSLIEKSSQIIVNGEVNVSGMHGGAGGKIKILGEHIELLDNAIINASGFLENYDIPTLGLGTSVISRGSSGGEIFIGCDELIKNNGLTALTLSVAANAKIYNDAYGIGDAGSTIFWSSGITNFSGQVYARSLGTDLSSNYGKGGFVEISGSKQLILNNNYLVNLTATNAKPGTLLLDPINMTINNNLILNNNTANIEVIADNIIFDLENNIYDLADNINFSVNANNSISVISGGTINSNRTVSGGNIEIINNNSNEIDLSSINFNANNGGLVKIISNGFVILGNIKSGSLLVEAQGAYSNIIIPDNKTIVVTDKHNPLVLVASGNFINLNSLDNQVFIINNNTYWKIYSATPVGNLGVSNVHIGESIQQYNTSYPGFANIGINNPDTNLLIYTTPPPNNLLTIIPNINTIYLTYGDPVPDLSNITFMLHGYLAPDDSIKDLITGAPIYRTNYNQYNGVGSYNITVTTGTLKSSIGYIINGNVFLGAIIVNKKLLTPILIKEVAKTYDGTTIARLGYNGYLLEGIINNNTVFLKNN